MPLTAIEQKIINELAEIRNANEIQLRFLEDGEDVLEPGQTLEDETRYQNIQERKQALTFWERIVIQNATEKALQTSYERLEKIRKTKPSKLEVGQYLNIENIVNDAFMALASTDAVPPYEEAKQKFIDELKDGFIYAAQESLKELVDSLDFDNWLDLDIEDNRKHAEDFLKNARFYSSEHLNVIEAVIVYLNDIKKIEAMAITDDEKEEVVAKRLEQLQHEIIDIKNSADFQGYADQVYGEQYGQKIERSFRQLYNDL